MKEELDKKIIIFSKFIEQITQGVEGFTYEGKNIGSNIFLLNHIKSQNGCSMKDVIQFLKVIPSAATRRVEKLIQLNLITRSIPQEDRRSINLNITDEGEKLILRFIENRKLGLNFFIESFNPTEIEVFFSVLERMVQIGPRNFTLEKITNELN